MRYFIGLGSNIAPHRHMALMLQALLEIAPTIHVGRIVETAPVGFVGAPFLNAPACLSSDWSPDRLKAFLNAIEARLGRNRDDPESKRKSRTADLDILFWLDDQARLAPDQLLPSELYMRPMLLELLGYLGITTTAELPAPPAATAMTLDGLTLGLAPLTLTRVAGSQATVSGEQE